ncbi:MAG: hypothetical protein EB023_02545 [Flavobacteriia bacterium]|jgi:hypothetical protein|nr:hypothetical protein [Flavobacteriia bacterium]
MKAKDLIPSVSGVHLAFLFDSEEVCFSVYLYNAKEEIMEGIIVTSVGYEKEDNPAETTKTATLRHSLEVLLPGEYAKVENLMPEVFPLYNEFWVSFWIEDILYDKKFLFLPDSVIIEKLTLLPTFNKKGILLT